MVLKDDTKKIGSTDTSVKSFSVNVSQLLYDGGKTKLTYTMNKADRGKTATSEMEDKNFISFEGTTDTLLKALDNRDKYVSNINLKGWISTIMRNSFINNYHKDICHKTIIDQTEDLYHINLPQNRSFYTLDSAFTLKDINRAISSLSDNFRITLSMFIVGYKYSDIATALNISVGTVKSRIFIARQKLQIVLKDYR